MQLAIFGTGRVGLSLAQYARHLGMAVDAIGRAEAEAGPAAIRTRIDRADLIAAAIPDDRIAPWFAVFGPAIGARPAIHFSGALTVPGMRGYHPLYSFPRTPLAPEVTARIAIAREEGAPAFGQIFPGARNPEFEIRPQDRALYHALAVLSGNFAAHLWNESAKVFAARFAAPPEAMRYYLAGVVDRFAESPFNSLTGPVARKDRTAAEANLRALAGEPRLAALYRAFLDSAWPDRPRDLR